MVITYKKYYFRGFIFNKYFDANNDQYHIAEPHLNLIPSVIENGRRTRNIGSQIYHCDPTQTFHDFLEELAEDILGCDWISKQQNPPHILMRYANKYSIKKRTGVAYKCKYLDGNDPTITGNNDLYWLLFCYDLFVLQHKMALTKDLVARLKKHKEFQGARYELAVAAMFLRAGFEIDWIEKDKQSGKSCEFIATHRATGIKVGVEAKSRKRRGVIHEAPGQDSNQGVSKLLKDAEEKKTPGNIPLVILLETNLPYVKAPKKQLFNEVIRAADNPCDKENYAWLVINNFPFHYQDDISIPENITILPNLNPWLNVILRDDLKISISRYPLIPEEI